MARFRSLLPRLLFGCFLLTVASSCETVERSLAPFSQPGWGRPSVLGAERMSVRVVPAAAAPRRPGVALFRPGWGQRFRGDALVRPIPQPAEGLYRPRSD